MKSSTMVWVVCSMVLGLLMASPVMADGLGDIGNRLAEQMGGLASMFELGGYFVGVVFIVMSLITFANARSEGTGMGVPLMFFVAGILLLSMGAWISAGSESVFGSDEANKAFQALQDGSSQLGN